MTPKQAAFVEEYLIDLNATRAYAAAGYKGSENVCAVEGGKLLRNPQVADAVRTAMVARSQRTEITQDMVLQELAKIGFSDIRKMFTETGRLVSISELDDASAAALSSIEIVTRKGRGEDEVEEVAKVKLWDKRAALVDIGKHLGMFTDRFNFSGQVSVVQTTETDERI